MIQEKWIRHSERYAHLSPDVKRHAKPRQGLIQGTWN